MEGNGADHRRMEKPEPLTEAEQETVRRTWVKVYENKEVAGVAVLVRYPSSTHGAIYSHVYSGLIILGGDGLVVKIPS